MRRCVLILLFVVGHVSVCCALDVRGPYLTELRPHEATIMFHTNEDADLVLEYHKVSTPARSFREHCYQARTHLFRLTGLQPDSHYSYRVSDSRRPTEQNGIRTEWLRFTTPPESPRRFSFIVYGDSRDRNPKPVRHRAVAGHFLRHRPGFVVSTGDLLLGGKHASASMFSTDWTENFFRPLHGVLQTVPYFLVVGNHDQDSEDAVKGVHRAFPRLRKSFNYSFQYGNTYFIVLHVANRMKEFRTQEKWFVEELTKARQADWRIVFLHVSPFTNGKYRKRKWTLAGREDFLKTCVQNGVDVVFSGHDHSYQRFHPLKAASSDDHSVLFVVTALAGTNPYEAVQDDFTAKVVNGVDHFCVVDVTPERIGLTAFGGRNWILDRVVLSKGKRQDGRLWQAEPLE